MSVPLWATALTLTHNPGQSYLKADGAFLRPGAPSNPRTFDDFCSISGYIVSGHLRSCIVYPARLDGAGSLDALRQATGLDIRPIYRTPWGHGGWVSIEPIHLGSPAYAYVIGLEASRRQQAAARHAHRLSLLNSAMNGMTSAERVALLREALAQEVQDVG